MYLYMIRYIYVLISYIQSVYIYIYSIGLFKKITFFLNTYLLHHNVPYGVKFKNSHFGD